MQIIRRRLFDFAGLRGAKTQVLESIPKSGNAVP
jgi:hypothetical protein